MKIKLLSLIIISLLFSGCVNLYTRCPGTKAEIIDTYQCTKESAAFSIVVMFPQVMNPTGGNELYPENIITIPLGLLCFVDVACEGSLDTVLYPADYFISKSRKLKNENNK